MSENIERAKNVPVFVQWVCSSIPMVFDDSLSYYEALAALWKYLQDTVDVVNNNATVTEEYIQLTKDMKDYMDHYFDNLDVQDEINNKLNQMIIDGSLSRIIGSYIDTYINETINPLVDNQNARISTVEDTVNAMSSFAPIPVASTSAMTDHAKTYVNTTDGKWYYWNGSAWTIGGTYQAVSLGDNSVSLRNLTNDLASNIYHQVTDVNLLGKSYVAGYTSNMTSTIFVKAGTTIEFSDDFVSNYEWSLYSVGANNLSLGNRYTDYSTDTTYTFTVDKHCRIAWRPIDSDWSSTTYTVDKKHYLDNNDVTNITYYYPIRETNTLIDLDSNDIKSNLVNAGYSSGDFNLNNWRLGITRPIKSSADIVISIDSILDFGIITWDLSNGLENKTVISDTGWLNNVVKTIPANTYFTFTTRYHDDSQFTTAPETIINSIRLRSLTSLNEMKSYVDTYISGTSTYNYTGENLNLQFEHGYDSETLMDISLATTSSQGFDIYNDQYIVQLYATNTTIQIVDYSTGTELGVIANVGFDHGDTCQFSNTFYDAGDLLPLLYVTSDTTPAKVHIVRIRDLHTASVVKTYTLDNDAGYYAGECYDFENNLMYVFGYKQNEFHTNTGGTNNVIVSVYDMSQETLISGINYSLELLDRWEIPFIYCVQGQKFLNGKCYLVSSYLAAEQHTIIYVYDPVAKRMIAKFDDMPLDLAVYETEDIAFVKGTNKYEIVAGTRQKYIKLSFTN